MKQQPPTPNTIKIRLWGNATDVAEAALKLRDCFVVVNESGDVRDRRGSMVRRYVTARVRVETERDNG